MKSIEQLCRDVLEVAIADDLVARLFDPQTASAGDLVGVANLVNEYMRPKWISVADRLPDDERAVLVCWSLAGPRPGVWRRPMDSAQYLHPNGVWTCGGAVSHWMELPPPPV